MAKLNLPDDGIYGAWLDTQDSTGEHDVHILIGESESVVIGVNTPDLYSGKMRPSYTNPALVINREKCYLQYMDGDGKFATKDLDEATVRKALTVFLEDLKADYV